MSVIGSVLLGAALGGGGSTSNANSLSNTSTVSTDVNPSFNLSIGGGVASYPAFGDKTFNPSSAAVAQASGSPNTPTLPSLGGLGIGSALTAGTPSASSGFGGIGIKELVIGAAVIYGAWKLTG